MLRLACPIGCRPVLALRFGTLSNRHSAPIGSADGPSSQTACVPGRRPIPAASARLPLRQFGFHPTPPRSAPPPPVPPGPPARPKCVIENEDQIRKKSSIFNSTSLVLVPGPGRISLCFSLHFSLSLVQFNSTQFHPFTTFRCSLPLPSFSFCSPLLLTDRSPPIDLHSSA